MDIRDLIKSKEMRKSEILTLGDSCTDLEQMKAYNNEMRNLSSEIEALKQAQAELDNGQQGISERTKAIHEYENGQQGEGKAQTPVPVFVKTENNITNSRQNNPADIDDDPTNNIEYRKMFMGYVQGKVKKEEIRAAVGTTTTDDVGAVIPTILINQIIDESPSFGMILSRVTHVSYPAGVKIPKTRVRPKATWVKEGEGSQPIPLDADCLIFTEHKIRCEVSETLEVATMALSAWEEKFVSWCAEAIAIAVEEKIISEDSGVSSCKGIFYNADLEKIINVSAMDYSTLISIEGEVEDKYENTAVWLMAKKTFYNTFLGMVDVNGQPIARVNAGVDGKVMNTLLGREVVFTSEYLPTFDKANEGDIFAGIVDLKEYTLNEISSLAIYRRDDWNTEDKRVKAVGIYDGQRLTDKSAIVLKKGSTTKSAK